MPAGSAWGPVVVGLATGLEGSSVDVFVSKREQEVHLSVHDGFQELHTIVLMGPDGAEHLRELIERALQVLAEET